MTAAKLALAAFLLGYLLKTSNLDFSKLAQINGWGWLALAQVFVALMLGLTFYRWHLLLRAQGIQYQLKESFILSFIGFFFSQFVPGSTGGDLVKAYYVAVEQPELRAAGITTVVVDRVIGLVVFMVVGGVAILANWQRIQKDPYLKFFSALVAALLLLILLGLSFFLSDRIRRSAWFQWTLGWLPFQKVLRQVGSAMVAYKRQPRIIFVAVGLSVLVQASTVFMTLCYARALGDDRISLVNLFFLVPLALLIMALPINPPGGLGVGEWAYSKLFAWMGDPENGLPIAIVQRINWYAWALVGLFFYLRKKKKIQKALSMGEEAAQSQPASVAAPTA